MTLNWKRFLLPLLVLLVLIVVLVLLLLGNRPPKDAAVPTTVPTESTAPALVTPEEAAAKLSEAHSLQLTVSMLNQANTYSYENAYTFQMSNIPDGAQTILFSQSGSMVSGSDIFESVGDQAFYLGRTAFIRYAHSDHPNTATKRINDESFVLTSVVAEQTGLSFPSGGNSMVAAFAALSPTANPQADGSVCYRLQNMTPEQFSAVYSILAGRDATQEILNSMGNSCSANIQADVDPQGYLTQFKLELLNVASNDGTQNITILFTIDRINAIDSIEIPDYVTAFTPVNNTQIICTQEGQTAHYFYYTTTESDTNNLGLVFGGFGDTFADDYTVESYEIPSQIDGTSVTEVQSILNNTFCSVNVARLVIPTGVKVNIRGVYADNAFESYTKNTVLFFNDKQEDVEKTFFVEGETTNLEEAVFFKAAYYAGQWEYVDGIPTPKNG